jgi:DNA recombination protein RmuC
MITDIILIILCLIIIFGLGAIFFSLKQRDTKEELINEKKDYIKELASQIKEVVEKNQKQIQTAEKERIGEFGALKTIIEEHKSITSELKTSTDNLKNILSNNQLRGRYGEEVAEDLLKTAGFVKGESYITNTKQDTNQNRPDFTIFLPDKTKINVDAKFPLNSLLKYQETNDDQYLKLFDKDVKEKIKQVINRDYINPEEGTVDFVILFIPNEMIFSFIYDKLNETWGEAMKKKVILAGPFSFTAILRMIMQSYTNFTYQKNLHEIIKLIKTFEEEYTKYSNELDKLGNQIETVSKTYSSVSITRDKKLTKVIDKIKGENNEFKEIK